MTNKEKLIKSVYLAGFRDGGNNDSTQIFPKTIEIWVVSYQSAPDSWIKVKQTEFFLSKEDAERYKNKIRRSLSPKMGKISEIIINKEDICQCDEKRGETV